MNEQVVDIRASTVLPRRGGEKSCFIPPTDFDLVGELAQPLGQAPVATLICLIPLPRRAA